VRVDDVACVVLASGLSERFGSQDKLSVDLCGKPVLDHVLDTVGEVGFGEMYIVTQSKKRTGFQSVINGAPEKGLGQALRLGLKSAQNQGWENIVIALGDMPLIRSSTFLNLVKRMNEFRPVISSHGEQKMPPAGFQKTTIEFVLKQTSTEGAKVLFERLDPIEIDLDIDEAMDVDTPSDLIKVASVLKARDL